MRVARLITHDIANGPGIRVSLFVSGCIFKCPGCFNEIAQDFNYGEILTEEMMDDIKAKISDPRVSGISFLGGDPLCQDEEGLLALCRLAFFARSIGKTVWLWSGYRYEDVMASYKGINDIKFAQQTLVSLCDVMVDGRFEIANKNLSLHWKGSSNQRVIDIKRSLAAGEVVLYEEEF